MWSFFPDLSLSGAVAAHYLTDLQLHLLLHTKKRSGRGWNWQRSERHTGCDSRTRRGYRSCRSPSRSCNRQANAKGTTTVWSFNVCRRFLIVTSVVRSESIWSVVDVNIYSSYMVSIWFRQLIPSLVTGARDVSIPS